MVADILLLMFIHWIGDFVCQTHWQASNKSKNIDALTRHVASYTLVLGIGSLLIFNPLTALMFTFINCLLHLLTDFFTSKATAVLYARKDYHNFFVVVGIDQYIHYVALIGTMALIQR